MKTYLKINITAALFAVAMGGVQAAPVVPADLLHKFTAVNGDGSSDAGAGDLFGRAVSLYGTTALVGSHLDNDNGQNDSGSVYLFDTVSGNLLHKFTAVNLDGTPDASASDFFGYSVSLYGTTALVGSYFDDDNSQGNSGSAYLFDTVSGNLLHKFTAINGGGSSDAGGDDSFGISVSLYGTTALVGSYHDDDNSKSNSGSAYLFDTVSGNLLHKFTAANGDGSPDAGTNDFFGESVSLHGTRALVGSPNDDDNGQIDSGSAYLFDTVSGDLIHKFTPINTNGSLVGSPGVFGSAVSLSGTSVLVGSSGDDNNGQAQSGSAYLFDATSGDLLHKFTAEDTGGTPDAEAFDYFGYSVSLSDTTVLVGSYAHDDNGLNDSGSAYLFDSVTGDLLHKYTAINEDGSSDAATDNRFGISVSHSDTAVLVGSYFDDDGGSNSGSAYLFVVPEPTSLALFGLAAVGFGMNRKRCPVVPESD